MTVVIVIATSCKDDDISVTGVKIDITTLSLTAPSTGSLVATVMPEDATNKAVTWTTGDPNIATVSSDGQVTAVGEGITTITVTTEDGKKSAICAVFVNLPNIPVTGITLNEDELTFDASVISNQQTLTANVVPKEATNQGIRWVSSDTDVAIVINGEVTAISQGTATITAITMDGDFELSCIVTVNDIYIPVSGVELNKSTLLLLMSDTETLQATVFPTNASNQRVSWSSSNTGIATVDANGKITAGTVEGLTIITVTSEDGSFTQTCTVAVYPQIGVIIPDPVSPVNCGDPNVVCLNIGQSLTTAITDNPGKIIYLPSGYTFTWSPPVTFVMPEGGIHIIGEFVYQSPTLGDLNPPRPRITVTSATMFSTVGRTSGNDVIRFENVDIISTNANGFLTNAATGAWNIKELSFENCIISGFAQSLVRSNNATQVYDLVQFNKCLINNVSHAASSPNPVIQSNGAGSMKEIKITNTTVNAASNTFIDIVGGAGAAGAENVLVENVTFYRTVGQQGTNRWLINAGNNGPVNITINNCILGSIRGVGGVRRERGITMHESGTLIVENTYATTDWTTVEEHIPNTIPYSGNCAALFVDPENGNFRIKDLTFLGRDKVGDPRWWYFFY